MPTDYERILADNLREYGEGTRHLAFLGRLYTDRTHFIFELLQNAEDARATSIRFELYPDRLDVWHDGRVFDERDVRGVCGVGETTKAEDLTRIGKFGVGFKSVYAYTLSPEIHSGNEHFRIESFIRPRLVASRALPPRWTTLQQFPFTHEEITPEDAFGEIRERLEGLGARTLLFLRHIAAIEWAVEDGPRGIYLREDQHAGAMRRVTLIGQHHDRDEIDEEWLAFERPILREEEGGAVRVEVAYRLRREDDNVVVAPIRDSQLVVFFPTEKETHLGFLIQGPYRTTPARDNIPTNDAWNNRLVEETAALVVETLHELKTRGLMGVGLLQSLPIQSEYFYPGTMFRPIYDSVRAALRGQSLLPARDGKFVAAREAKIARRNEASLVELFAPRQLAELFERSGELHWLAPEISEGDTPQLYRYLIGQRSRYGASYTMIEPLVDEMEVRPETIATRLTERFLGTQSDDWVASIYGLFAERQALWPILKNRACIRLEDGSHVEPLGPDDTPNAYLPAPGFSGLPTVRQMVAADEDARRFLKGVGLSEPDAVANVLQHTLPKYRDSGARITDPLGDLRQIIHALGTDSYAQKERLLSAARSTPFVAAWNPATGDERFVRPGETYLWDDEFAQYFDHNEDCWFVDYDGVENEQAVRAALIEMGVATQVRVSCRSANSLGYVVIRSWSGDHIRGLQGFDPDCKVDGLESALSQPTLDTARYVWNRLLIPHVTKIRGVVEYSTRKTYENAKAAEEYSTPGQIATDREWLPARHGGFHRPDALLLDDLPDGFERSEALAEALGMRISEARALAQELGINVADMALLRSNQDRLQEFVAQLRSSTASTTVGRTVGVEDGDEQSPDADAIELDAAESADDEELDYHEAFAAAFTKSGMKEEAPLPLPPGPVGNPALRRERVAAAIVEARSAEPDSEQRFRRVPTKRWESRDNSVRAFLRNQYLGECQICGSTFQRRDGNPYFEGVYIVPRARARWIDRPGNVLCLCATCCAKFQYGPVAADDIMREIEEYRTAAEGGTTEPELHLVLCGRPIAIRFTEAHLLDLQELLLSAEDKEERAITSDLGVLV